MCRENISHEGRVSSHGDPAFFIGVNLIKELLKGTI